MVARPDERPFEAAPPEIVGAMKGTPPTVQQWEAISHDLSPCVLIAGAGSGKTAVMAARLVYLALARLGRIHADHQGALPSEVLCLTFTNKAAEELAERVRVATEGLGLPEGEAATVLTYHAFAARLLDDFGIRIGLEPGQLLLSEAQRWQLGRTLLRDRTFEHVEVRTDYVVGQALSLADECANHLRDPMEVAEAARAFAARPEIQGARGDDRRLLETALKRSEIAELAAAYRDAKRARGAMDYGDQIAEADRLVRRFPDVAREFRDRYRVVLLDEYQDTNVAQARLLAALCGRDYPVFAVGDPDQNIYAWRGASLGNLLRFPADFARPGSGTQRPLYVNFRSGSRILAVADRVIGEVPEERRAADKTLRPHPPLGEGRVQAFLASDATAEARHIASIIRRELETRRTHDGEPAYRDVAILCRKSRLFEPISEALREAEIPVEVVDLRGLLRLPEVVEVTAWLRLLDDPGHNVSLARILQGPRWRIGFRDLAALARWSARRTRTLGEELREREVGGDDRDLPGDVAFALVESVDHLDDGHMDGLSDEARERLEEFREVLARLRQAVGGPLEDLLAAIIEESGLLQELEASRSPAAGGARRNLLNLVEHVAAFAPIDGEASLSTLISYLDVTEEKDEDLERAQPSEVNTVKMLTIHKAKGLEWPIVFLPGLAEHENGKSDIFPDTSRQANPATQPATLPFELRGDADMLPVYEGKIAPFRAQLRERGLEEERRLCYVAITRARELLVASAAHWYEGPAEAHRRGTFYGEIAGHEASEVLFEDPCPDENPLIEARRRRVGDWPGAARRPDADELFPEGWHAAARQAVADSSLAESRAASLGAGVADTFRERVAADRERAQLIRDRVEVDRAPPAPSTLSVSSVIDYVKCPKLFFWSHVRPLPRRPNPSARLGSEVHRWIELQGSGQATLLDVDELPDLSTDERLGEPPPEQRLKQAFRASRFAARTPLYTERPFLLYLEGMVVGGRIDAVFGSPDGAWEVVDYKTGRVPPPGDPLTGLQLDLYGLACVDVWGKRPEDVTLTYFYLSEGAEVTRAMDDPEPVRARVLEVLSGIARGAFDPTPGRQCGWCDFRSFCPPGRRYLAASPPEAR